MAKNRRKSYDDYLDDAGSAEGIPCADCGCRHSYVVRTEKIGATVRRHCGRTFYTTEAA